MKNIIICFFLSVSYCLQAQPDFNLELISNVEIGEAVNDIWGYVAEDGTEYAIVGSVRNTTIFSLADLENPQQIAQIEGSNSTWRDIKSWDDHVYVVADAGNDGLLIIDMSQAPDTVTHKFWQPILEIAPDTAQLDRCHNLYIDENGFAYLAGCRAISDRDSRGAIIFDLKEDPKEPVYVGAETRAYAHDLYVRDNIMYASEIYNGEIALYDVTDKADPILLGTAPTSTNFTHNAWIDDSGQYVFTTDERANAFVDAFDISDPSDIKLLDKFQPVETANRGVIPHNTHYHNGFLVTSWYTDGVVLTDVHRPENMVKVGSYDTFQGPDGGFSGCWGAYPFLPSGVVLASDRSTGLYVLNPTYTRACYLEGNITDANTGNPVNGAEVVIESGQANLDMSDAKGNYKTGQAESGNFNVLFTHPDYLPLETEARLENGIVTILDAALQPVEPIAVNVTVLDADDGSIIDNAQLEFTNEFRQFDSVTDSTGNSEVTLTNETYNIIVGAWGYQQREGININPELQTELEIVLERGYEDDFVLDLGWTVTGDATTGTWTRAIPLGTVDPDDPNVISNVNFDIADDIGEKCYVTGNNGGSAGDDDVDNGVTILTSPLIKVPDDQKITEISYTAWFFIGGGGGEPFNDTLKVFASDGTTKILIDSYAEPTFGWTEPTQISMEGLDLDFTNGITVSFEASDDAEAGHFVEAGVDLFRVTSELISSTNEIQASEVSIYPNPFDDFVHIQQAGDKFSKLEVYNLMGQRLLSKSMQPGLEKVNLNGPAGIYTLILSTDSDVRQAYRIVKR